MELIDSVMNAFGAISVIVLTALVLVVSIWSVAIAAIMVRDNVRERIMLRKSMKLFVFGSRTITDLTPAVTGILDSFIDRGAEIIVGDCYGVDSSVQRYLNSRNYTNVTIYTSCEKPRCAYVTGCRVVSVNRDAANSTSETFHSVKDIAMTMDCDSALALWDGSSIGTRTNISRIKSMGKPCKVMQNVTDSRTTILKRPICRVQDALA